MAASTAEGFLFRRFRRGGGKERQRVVLRRGGGGGRDREFAQDLVELEAAAQLRDPGVVGLPARERLRSGKFLRQFAAEPHELQVLSQQFALPLQLFAVLFGRDPFRSVDPRFDGAAGVEQFRRAFGADPRYAGDVVRGVADERQIVGDQLRRHAEFFHDLRFAALDEATGVAVRRRDEFDPRVHELREILVRADDPHVARLFREREGPGEVVRLVVFAGDQRPAERLRHFPYPRHLELQLLRHRRTVRLVLRVDPQPEVDLAAVEEHRAALRRVLLRQVEQQPGEDEERVDRFALRVGEAADREKRTENLTVGVDQDQHFEITPEFYCNLC